MSDDLLDEIYQYLENPIRYEHYLMALCPWHDDHKASFAVYPDTYRCMACGAKGKTSKLLETLRKKHGVFFAKKSIDYFKNPWRLWHESYGDLDIIIDRAHDYLLSKNKTVYLASRGIDLEIIKELRIGWLDDWITIPFHDETGKIIGATARAGETNKSQAKYCNPHNQDPNLLYVPSYKYIRASDKMFLTFGIIDAISIYQLGYASASTTTGKRIDPEAFDDIRKPIFIIPDVGEEVAACQLSAHLGWRGKVLKIDYPEDAKDCNDLFLRHKDLLISILENNNV